MLRLQQSPNAGPAQMYIKRLRSVDARVFNGRLASWLRIVIRSSMSLVFQDARRLLEAIGHSKLDAYRERKTEATMPQTETQPFTMLHNHLS